MPAPYDAFLLVSFGGPEQRDDVIPFLENVLRGRNVPRERLLAVAEHYYHFEGRSPINQQCRDLIAALKTELPVYWGNRNWNPYLADTVREMKADGVTRALALATSAFGSYSGCRQYREDIERARVEVPGAPEIDKIPPFWNHPKFIAAVAARIADARARLPNAELVFTAHSIPVSMAQSSPYEQQLRAAAALASDDPAPAMAFQSRSGPPSQPWLGPDICDYIRNTDSRRLIVVPIGFLSDHMEVLYDLDTEAAKVAADRGIAMVRAATPGTHPLFIECIHDLIDHAQKGSLRACAPDCCQRA